MFWYVPVESDIEIFDTASRLRSSKAEKPKQLTKFGSVSIPVVGTSCFRCRRLSNELVVPTSAVGRPGQSHSSGWAENKRLKARELGHPEVQ